jgi:signal transduction histidine kinase
VDAALDLVNGLMKQVRELSLTLRPTMLDDLGLLPTLLWHFERYETQTQVNVVFGHANLEARFASETETAAYRIVQEALTNVARYAGVNEVSVRLWADDDVLGIEIRDDGIGFDAESGASLTSSGLNGMRERALLLQGKLEIDSAPGEGTRIVGELPLHTPAVDAIERRQESR